jgi:hypothetical protein
MPPQLAILNRPADLPAPGEKKSALYLMELRAAVGRKQPLKRRLRPVAAEHAPSEVRPQPQKRVRN